MKSTKQTSHELVVMKLFSDLHFFSSMKIVHIKMRMEEWEKKWRESKKKAWRITKFLRDDFLSRSFYFLWRFLLFSQKDTQKMVLFSNLSHWNKNTSWNDQIMHRFYMLIWLSFWLCVKVKRIKSQTERKLKKIHQSERKKWEKQNECQIFNQSYRHNWNSIFDSIKISD